MIIGTKKRIKEGEQPKPTRYYSNKQEKAVVAAVGGRQTKNSGATLFDDALADVGVASVDILNRTCNWIVVEFH